ncbi:hypothetical protein MMC12_005439 [Toensbergia leucococca]|nr:hypothetical protein [Toensbergia leucococca]
MCRNIIENYAGCGCTESSPLPCVGFLDSDSGTCPAPEKDVIHNHPEHCRDCKSLQEAFAQINSDSSLAPVPQTSSQDPTAPKLFFKERIHWPHCGHYSHPRYTDFERNADDPEYGITLTGIGSCHKCSEAPPSLLAEMKRSGKLAQEDPWGAMSDEPEIGEGGSGSASAGLSNEAIAMCVPDSKLRSGTSKANPATASKAQAPKPPATFDDSDDDLYAATPPGSPPTHPSSPPPDFDDLSLNETLPGTKGKGRSSHPAETYASRHGGPAETNTSDSDSDSEPEDQPTPRGRRSPHPSAAPRNWGSGAKQSDDDSSDDEDEDHHAAEGEGAGGDDEGALVDISAEERAALRIPLGMELTRRRLARFKDMKARADAVAVERFKANRGGEGDGRGGEEDE